MSEYDAVTCGNEVCTLEPLVRLDNLAECHAEEAGIASRGKVGIANLRRGVTQTVDAHVQASCSR